MTIGIDEQISPDRLAQVIVDRLSTEESPIAGYWYEVRGGRDEYAAELRGRLVGIPAVVVVVRELVFDNPDAVQAEFVGLIDNHRVEFEELFSSFSEHPPTVAVVMLTRRAPDIPQVASPATMPRWFPRVGGREVPVYLRDLTWTGGATIDSDESAVPAISAGLFALDGDLLDRCASVHGSSPAAGDAFWRHVVFRDRMDFLAFLQQWREFRRTVRSPRSFRPDGGRGTTLVARLWRLVQRTPPEGIGAVARDVAAALDLPEQFGREWYQSFASVLGRPAARPSGSAEAFSSGILRTVAVSAQFITVAAHAGDYGKYPVALLRSTSLDLLTAMQDASVLLHVLDRSPAGRPTRAAR